MEQSPGSTHTAKLLRNLKCQFCGELITFPQWFSQDCESRDGGHLCFPVGPLGITIPGILED